MCFALGLNPMPFIKQMNRGQERQHHEEAHSEGLEPWQRWLTDLFDTVMRLKFGFGDLTFRWEEDEAIDPAEQATIDVQLVTAKVYHPDEIRAKRGDDPMDGALREQMDMASYNPAPNATVLSPEQQAAQNEHSLALAAAKPAPVVAAKPSAKESDAQKSHELALAKLAATQITVQAATPPAIALPAINVTTPPVTVNMPEIKTSDVFVDIGPTTLQAKFDAPNATRKGTRTITYERTADGTLVGKITETDSRTVRGEKNADGSVVAKIEG
jgi:hypothetical protein